MAEPQLPLAPDSMSNADDRLLRPSLPLRRRKRAYPEPEANSSDPPQFSSDGLERSAEDYLTHRRKRQYKRAWFENEDSNCEVTEPLGRRSRGPFRRNFDSGIHMPSEDSTDVEPCEKSVDVGSDLGSQDDETIGQADSDPDGSLESVSTSSDRSILQEERVKKAMRVFDSEDPMDFQGPVFPYWQPQPKDLDQFHRVQSYASRIIQRCIEEGGETVDLSDISMEQIRSGLLRPLRHHIRQFHSDACTPLTPSLKLHLSHNQLLAVPGELYHLRNLTVLTLRNNQITELLPAIAELSSLTELNIGGNQIRCLPYELVSLRKLWACRGGLFTVHPNPLIEPWPPVRFPHRTPFSPREIERRPVLVTPIAFLDTTGQAIDHSPPAPTQRSQYRFTSADSSPEFCPSRYEQTHTPSLLELCLRTLLHEPTLSQLPFLLPPDSPPHLSALLQQAFRLRQADSGIVSSALVDPSACPTSTSSTSYRQPDEQERQRGAYSGASGQRCTICRKRFVIPRTEWVEWWNHGNGHTLACPRLVYNDGHVATTLDGSDWTKTSETWSIMSVIHPGSVPIPFLRRGCSWACFERKYLLGQKDDDEEEEGEEEDRKKTNRKPCPIPLKRGWKTPGAGS